MVEPREWSHRIRRCLTLLIAAASIGNAVAAESVITYHNAANRSGLYVAPTLSWTRRRRGLCPAALLGAR
jgi:hypothetical protein